MKGPVKKKTQKNKKVVSQLIYPTRVKAHPGMRSQAHRDWYL